MKKADEKKVYESPKLYVYGDIRTITQAINDMGVVADGGAGMTTKTS
jgi:hypothetical protein